jgi:predicted secreted protein
MAEHATQAISGRGAQLKRGGLLSTDPYVNLHEVVSFEAPNDTAEEIDVTHLESPGGRKEFIAGMVDSGEATATLNWRPDIYSEQALLRSDQADRALRYWQFVLPSSMETITFRAFVKGMKPAVTSNGALTMAVTFRVSTSTVT